VVGDLFGDKKALRTVFKLPFTPKNFTQYRVVGLLGTLFRILTRG
jgi:hypothetical protein